MSNEELAVLIQGGDRELLQELWAQVKRFVAKQANRRMETAGSFGGVEFEDLYSSGYIALVAAVDSFDADAGGSFINWLALRLKTTFAEAGGYRSQKQARDPLHRAGSLDTPAGEDEDGAALGELILDWASLQDFERVEGQLYRKQLHTALNTALGQIPAHSRAVIRRRYYRGQTIREIAAKMDTTPEMVQRWEGEALRALRHPRISRPLREYLPGPL